MKEKVEINIILPDMLVLSPSFSDARIMTEIDFEKIRRKKEIKFRKDKIEKIKNELNKK
jgi:hypothetical protein